MVVGKLVSQAGMPKTSAVPRPQQRQRRLRANRNRVTPGLNPMVWIPDHATTVHAVKAGFNKIEAKTAIDTYIKQFKEYRWTRISVTWNPLFNDKLGTVSMLPYYDDTTSPTDLSAMISAGVRLRNGLQPFTQQVAVTGEQSLASAINGGVSIYVAASSANTHDLGWLRIQWEWSGRLPHNAVVISNPVIP